jgi:hypothetical protein
MKGYCELCKKYKEVREVIKYRQFENYETGEILSEEKAGKTLVCYDCKPEISLE